ncbi:polymer-forming cytoskeletal protein [Ehrlichia chaffeensis]|uniref:polymer-forming cytoskeletal protein n=1 Tax=Ehrlichia chaffeensis TaxID=945 RepID=UPI000444AC89|nr:polymer-forming cytoskeletal protein [Ehrlichia chaffeensis]AHX05300.1 hypothetical protein ECHJAX_0214 [Ehrlichia chaffeensis str. Jax]
MLKYCVTDSSRERSIPQCTTQCDKTSRTITDFNGRKPYMIKRYFVQFGSHKEIIKDLNDRVRHVYIKMCDLINQLSKEDSRAFFSTLCSSCMTSFFYDLSYLQYDLSIFLGCQSRLLEKVPNIVISEDTLCKLCEDLVSNYFSINNILLSDAAVSSEQAIESAGSATASTGVGSVSKQQDMGGGLGVVSDGNTLLIGGQMESVLCVMRQTQNILLRLQRQCHSSNQFMASSVDFPSEQFSDVKVGIHNFQISLDNMFRILKRLNSVLNIILLENEEKKSEFSAIESSICQNGSDPRLVKVLILNHMLNQKRSRLSRMSYQSVSSSRERESCDSIDMNETVEHVVLTSEEYSTQFSEISYGSDECFEENKSGSASSVADGRSIADGLRYDIPLKKPIPVNVVDQKMSGTDVPSCGEECDIHSSKINDSSSQRFGKYKLNSTSSVADGSRYDVPLKMPMPVNIVDQKMSGMNVPSCGEECNIHSSKIDDSSSQHFGKDKLNSTSSVADGSRYDVPLKKPIPVNVVDQRITDMSVPSTSGETNVDFFSSIDGHFTITSESGQLVESATLHFGSDVKVECGQSISSNIQSSFVVQDGVTSERDCISDKMCTLVNHQVFQYMKSEEGRNDLLKILIDDVGGIDRLVKVLVPEIGKDALIDMFPTMSLFDIESNLSDVVMKDDEGVFIRYCKDGKLKPMHLLQEFISYVNTRNQGEIEETVVSEQLHGTISKHLRSNIRSYSRSRDVVLRRSNSARISGEQRFENIIVCQDINVTDDIAGHIKCKSSDVVLTNSGTRKSQSFRGVSQLYSKERPLLVDYARSYDCSSRQDVSLGCVSSLKRSIFNKGSNLSCRYVIYNDVMLGDFVKNTFDNLRKSVSTVLKFTDKLSMQDDSILLHWVLFCIINNPNFDKCESVIMNDLKSCRLYYKMIISVYHLYYNKITSVPNCQNLLLHVKNLQDMCWVGSYVKPIHTLFHKGEMKGVYFCVGKDYVKCKIQQYIGTINVSSVAKLREVFKVIDLESITQENLDSFVVKDNLIVSFKYFKSASGNCRLDASKYSNVIIKGDIPVHVTLHCNNVFVYGNVKGRLLSCRDSVRIEGSVSGSIEAKHSGIDTSMIFIAGNVEKSSIVKVENSVVEVCGNVYGNIEVRSSNVILRGNVYKGSCVVVMLGMYLYFSSIAKGNFFLRGIKHVFINGIIDTSNLCAHECNFYIKENRIFKLSNACIDCEVKFLSRDLDVLELQSVMNKKVLERDTESVQTKALCNQAINIDQGSHMQQVSHCVHDVKINHLSDLMTI